MLLQLMDVGEWGEVVVENLGGGFLGQEWVDLVISLEPSSCWAQQFVPLTLRRSAIGLEGTAKKIVVGPGQIAEVFVEPKLIVEFD